LTYGWGLEKPSESGLIYVPGLPVLPIGTERYSVPGGGAQALKLFKGDCIELIDREGLQPGEITFFDSKGISCADFLGVESDGNADGLQSILESEELSAMAMRLTLKKKGYDVGRAEAIKIFREFSPPGNAIKLDAKCNGFLLVGAPGGPMLINEQNPSTELVLYVHRVNPLYKNFDLAPPPPLADPRVDINIEPGNAKAYKVKKGEAIQIVDVKGRECSDFQAFDLRALDAGTERDIDPTTTRSLMGSLYPTPGIFSKYFSVDHEPLVEIIQDTCGRHDTFGLACTARYYEDLGYPGHPNCSDNISFELGAFNIKPRTGWPSINFFFNTFIDSKFSIGMDDPWSRPGDYVLLRALTDLICISTACPCDVDAANGWNPTDIQVRVYKRNKEFKRSIGWRKTPESNMEDTKETGFHHAFSTHTRDFSEYNGYWLPNQMTNHGFISEYWACREKAAIMDLSPLRKYEITGPDAEALLQVCLTRDMKKLSVGQVVYTAMCYEHGGMIDDGTVLRLGENNFRWIGGNDDGGLWLRKQAKDRDLNAWVRTSTDQMSNIAVQGPLSREILKKIIWTPPTQPSIDELKWFRFSIGRINDFHGVACVISRTGYTGELGFEIFCHPKDAQAVFDTIWASGESVGMLPLGLTALNILRIEAGLIFSGYEFSDQTDPFEAGIGFTVPIKTKSDDFIGKAAILKRQENPQRKLIGLDIEGGLVPSSEDPLFIGKAQIGTITSAIKSPILGKVIAMARVDIKYTDLGCDLEIGQLDGHQKRLKCKTTSLPHFDPLKERVKGNY